MSASINEAATTATADRSVIATRRLCEALALSVSTLKPKQLKQLATALAEAALSEIDRDPAFGENILAIYQELTATPAPRSSANSAKHTAPRLTARRNVDPKLFGPDKPLDPYLLQYVYHDDQLKDALDRYPAGELKKAAAMVEQRNPGTKPTNRTRKPALIDYILDQLIGRPHEDY